MKVHPQNGNGYILHEHSTHSGGKSLATEEADPLHELSTVEDVGGGRGIGGLHEVVSIDLGGGSGVGEG